MALLFSWTWVLAIAICYADSNDPLLGMALNRSIGQFHYDGMYPEFYGSTSKSKDKSKEDSLKCVDYSVYGRGRSKPTKAVEQKVHSCKLGLDPVDNNFVACMLTAAVQPLQRPYISFIQSFVH